MLDAQLLSDDALEAFIGSGNSAGSEPLELRTARREAACRKLARVAARPYVPGVGVSASGGTTSGN
jgi:hypothetical protein